MGRFARIRLIQALAILAFMPALAARAADIAVPAPTYYPAYLPPALYNWTGVYFGGHVGGGILTDSVSQNASAPPFALSGSGDLRPSGVLGGAQLGANYEFAPWVFGAEFSWTDSGISGSTLIPCTGCEFPPPTGTTLISQERATSHTLWFATATGRFGYAANDWLFYGKVGGAWMHVSYTQDYLTIGGLTSGTQTVSTDRAGFTAGVGLEYGMTENLSGKIEFDFYDFGTQNYNFVLTPVSIQSNMYALTVGLNYRFNWTAAAPAPVIPPR
jgi:outer membrane immunogenic protein